MLANIGSATGGRNGLTKPIRGRDGNSFLSIPSGEAITESIAAIDSWLAADPTTRKRVNGKEWSVARTNALVRAGFPTDLLVRTVVAHGHTRQGKCGSDEPTAPRTVAESGLYQTAE